MKMKESCKVRLATLIFCLLSILFFAARNFSSFDSVRWLVAIPTLFAAFATSLRLKSGGKFIPLALLASAAGDWAGSVGNFILQIAFFAIAHLFYIADFLPCRQITKSKIAGAVALGIATISILSYVMMHIEPKVELVAVGIYGLIIFTMGASAIFQQRKNYAWYIVAALLFILSDSMIAYGRFVDSIPNGNTWVMLTYYAVQAMFMILMLSRKLPKE